MGNNQSDFSGIGTIAGEGYRIIDVKPNSPLQNKVDVFFDFIIDAIPERKPEKTAKEILNKLTDEQSKPQRVVKRLQQIFAENQNLLVTLKIVSTKFRNEKIIEVTPNRKWNETDLIGVTTRLQRYDQAIESFWAMTDIKINSPVKKAGISQGQFLIGCAQFKYRSLNQFVESLNEKYFDKTVEDKHVNFAVYDISSDQLKIVSVLLARGWGDKGLIGCQFVEGHLKRFPKNLEIVRNKILQDNKKSQENSKIKKQLSQCNGASVQLIESLKNQKNKKKKNVKSIINLPSIEPLQGKKQNPSPTSQIFPMKPPQKQKQFPTSEIFLNQPSFTDSENRDKYVSMEKYRQLQNRVSTLQSMLVGLNEKIKEMLASD